MELNDGALSTSSQKAMRMTGVTSGVEITTIADIPSRGTGLGSSSAVTVELLNALHAYAGREGLNRTTRTRGM